MEEEMFAKRFKVMMWINIYICYPLTVFVISWCCAVRMDRVPITYYINLLLLSLIQSVCWILLMAKRNDYDLRKIFSVILLCAAMAHLYFRMIIALERYFFISRPQLLFIRQTKGIVTICILVWVFCAVICPLCLVFGQFVLLILALALPGLVFIICLFLTLRSLCAATSVSTEEKRRTVATLVILLINYSVINLPVGFLIDFLHPEHYVIFYIEDSAFTLHLLNPYMDLILFVVMCKGLIDQLLTCLCCCRMEYSAGSDGSRGTSEAQTDQPTDRQNESQDKESKM